MMPFIQNGDAVCITPVMGSLRVGDVVLLRTKEGRVLLHRIVNIHNEGIITRGDASSCNDEHLPIKNVLGKAVNVSGRGCSFHLKYPWNYVISKTFIVRNYLSRYPRLKTMLKRMLGIRNNT